jgi:monofunctional biosynthetic peptidoglycan transglycosylase
MSASAAVLLVVLGFALLMSLPDIGQLEKCFTTSMFQVHLCPGSNNYVALKNISPYMLHAVIAAEDGSFYSHQGFDFHEMEESFNANLKSGKIQRGGSTLTQQLAKNAFLDKEKSYWRKAKEAYLAYSIEHRYSKSFILEKYLNVVEFGPNLYGVKPAAQHYFHKGPSELTPLESAYLAYLLPNPKVYSKSFAKGSLTPFGKKMVSIILMRMKSFGKLSEQAYEYATSQIDAFPWAGITLASFSDLPSYNLDTNVSPSQIRDESPIDEEALEELLREEERHLGDGGGGGGGGAADSSDNNDDGAQFVPARETQSENHTTVSRKTGDALEEPVQPIEDTEKSGPVLDDTDSATEAR